ncbi:hypothetical protein L1049_011178 [Liquidambar formosana]|uniref:Uncharacterized protein n=1 Tax=Liquidambar formosana TaxID=63359 RepID=A0AAP0X1V9_LIQFO
MKLRLQTIVEITASLDHIHTSNYGRIVLRLWSTLNETSISVLANDIVATQFTWLHSCFKLLEFQQAFN